MIQRSKTSIVGVLAIFIYAFPSFAQTKTPTHDSVRLRAQRAFEQMRKTPHRVTTTLEIRDTETEEWRPYSCFITEYSADRSYSRRCVEPLRESIQIRKDRYLRMSDGTWQLEKKKEPSGIVWKTEPVKVEVARLEPETAPEDGSVGFGVRSQVRTQRPSDGQVFERSVTANIWFDEQGSLVRCESVTFSEIPSSRRYMRRVEVYEYDNSIRIEIPVIVGQ